MPVIDSTVLLHFLDPDARSAHDPLTGSPVSDAEDRVKHLIRFLDDKQDKLIIPTPVLSEILVHAGTAGPDYIRELKKVRCFRIQAFDERAAIELASMTHDALATKDLRAGTSATRSKLKFDRQIIAIARTQNEKTIYSDDSDIAKLAKMLDLEVIPVYALPLPLVDKQGTFDFSENGKQT